MKTRMGRPKLPKGEAKGVLFAVRMKKPEADQVDKAIRQSGMSKPDWARAALLNAAGV